MAGIYDRVKPDAVSRISIEVLFSSLILRALGEYTSQEALDAINETAQPLQDGTPQPLVGQEITDMQGVLNEMVAQTTNTNRLVYQHKARAVFSQWEQGITVMGEARGRTVLSI